MPKVYKVKDWSTAFETRDSKRLQRLKYLMIPAKQEGDSFKRLLQHAHSTTVYGLFHMLAGRLAQQEKPREGWMTDDGTPKGKPWTTSDIAFWWHRSIEEVEMAMEVLCSDSVRWVENVDIECASSAHQVRMECTSSAHEARMNCASPVHRARSDCVSPPRADSDTDSDRELELDSGTGAGARESEPESEPDTSGRAWATKLTNDLTAVLLKCDKRLNSEQIQPLGRGIARLAGQPDRLEIGLRLRERCREVCEDATVKSPIKLIQRDITQLLQGRGLTNGH